MASWPWHHIDRLGDPASGCLVPASQSAGIMPVNLKALAVRHQWMLAAMYPLAVFFFSISLFHSSTSLCRAWELRFFAPTSATLLGRRRMDVGDIH